MTSVMDTQKQNVKKAFYAAVGTPMVAGRKFIDFSTDLLTETSLEDLETAGREVTGAIRESKVVEQIQESVDQFTPGVAGPQPVKVEVEAETPKPKRTTAKKTTASKAAPKSTAKKTASKPTAKKAAPKTTPKKATPKKASTEK